MRSCVEGTRLSQDKIAEIRGEPSLGHHVDRQGSMSSRSCLMAMRHEEAASRLQANEEVQVTLRASVTSRSGAEDAHRLRSVGASNAFDLGDG